MVTVICCAFQDAVADDMKTFAEQLKPYPLFRSSRRQIVVHKSEDPLANRCMRAFLLESCVCECARSRVCMCICLPLTYCTLFSIKRNFLVTVCVGK